MSEDLSTTTLESSIDTFMQDVANRVAREFKLVFALSDALRKLQTHFGSVVPRFNGDDSWELPMPGTFALDRQGS